MLERKCSACLSDYFENDDAEEEIEDEDIEAILNHYQDPRVVCREMIRAAHHGGGKDNITVVMAEIR